VVDDEPANRKLLRLILEDAGYDILEAEDGQEALQVLSSGQTPMAVDLIISDLQMPKVDGFEAIASFQKEYPSIPVIVLTGIGDPEVEASFMRQGVSDYLLKPVDVKTLIASVTDAIAQRQLSCA
jgi:CheY-like chemotaxis protein